MKIRTIYTSVDGYREAKTHLTINAARNWAARWVGQTPEVGTTYAIAGDGIGKITVQGCTIQELFPQ